MIRNRAAPGASTVQGALCRYLRLSLIMRPHSADGLCVYDGELEVGPYSLAFSPDGAPVRFTLPAYGLVIAFDSFTDEQSAAATEPTTIPKTYPVTDEVTEPVS